MYSVYLWIMEPPQTILWLGKQLSDQTLAEFEGNMPLLAWDSATGYGCGQRESLVFLVCLSYLSSERLQVQDEKGLAWSILHHVSAFDMVQTNASICINMHATIFEFPSFLNSHAKKEWHVQNGQAWPPPALGPWFFLSPSGIGTKFCDGNTNEEPFLWQADATITSKKHREIRGSASWSPHA